jgi:hypothetical protein
MFRSFCLVTARGENMAISVEPPADDSRNPCPVLTE